MMRLCNNFNVWCLVFLPDKNILYGAGIIGRYLTSHHMSPLLFGKDSNDSLRVIDCELDEGVVLAQVRKLVVMFGLDTEDFL